MNVDRIIELAKPSLLTMLLSFLISVFLVVGANVRIISDQFDVVEQYILINEYFGLSISNILFSLSSFTITSTIVTFLIWFTAGILLFSLLTVIINSFKEIEHDVEIDKSYIHPASYKSNIFWMQLAALFAVRFVSTLLILVILFAIVYTVLPLASDSISKIFNADIVLSNVVNAVLYFAVLVSAFIILVIVGKISISSFQAKV